ncbi:CDC27 family protein [Aequorivita todarodis]|uniref:tetratricopeptide repeat protein n=1 Tax=Aequorivita todarodis TaxID=2036821 RepID=UPI00235084A2|nr:tetratricopeptide repeat protein [Aequorivita todarodis]MDC7999699.1 CDC27 family protein [Aequorivita todarodis]
MDPNNNIQDNRETQELIDAYLLDTLDPEAQADFKERMKLYPEFRAMVEEQKTLIRGVEEHTLKNSLDNFHAEIVEIPEKKWLSPGWLALAASFLILISVSTWAILSSGNSPQKVFAANFKPDPGLPTTMSTSSNYDFYYGMVNYKRKEYNEAISSWETLYAANPENDTVVYFLGVANLANGNARQAKKYLQSAKEKPEGAFYEDALYYLALALLKENKIKEAEQVLSKSTSPASIVLLKEIKSL